MDLDRNKKVILYIVNEMGHLSGGSAKLMKMMFLIEHYDPKKGKLVLRGLLENDFFINNQGVFSNDVLRSFNDLVSGNKLEDRFPLKATVRSEFNDGEKERIDDIIYEFREVPDYDLNEIILTMLGIDSFHKRDFYGVRVRDLIREKLLTEEEDNNKIDLN